LFSGHEQKQRLSSQRQGRFVDALSCCHDAILCSSKLKGTLLHWCSFYVLFAEASCRCSQYPGDFFLTQAFQHGVVFALSMVKAVNPHRRKMNQYLVVAAQLAGHFQRFGDNYQLDCYCQNFLIRCLNGSQFRLQLISAILVTLVMRGCLLCSHNPFSFPT
jgi:hypothetical protein